MLGGGAERIMISLANAAVDKGYGVSFILTSQSINEAVGYSLDKRINFFSLCDSEYTKQTKSIKIKLMKKYGNLVNGFCKHFELQVPDSAVYCRFASAQSEKIEALYNIIYKNPNATVIAFLDNAIQIALLAMKELPNKLIISERGDPSKHDSSKAASLFIRKYYKRANIIVFQTEDAKKYFDKEIQKKCVIIPNPIKDGLPERYIGERKKIIVNYCRVSFQKNIPLLIEAFNIFKCNHIDYTLEIIGEANSTEAIGIVQECQKLIKKYGLEESVKFKPFDPNLHEKIKDYSMFVSSSDFEGMSNSMLEAMAIGLPTICTDCPSGGARAVIKNGENGLLTKVGDMYSIANAMSLVADNHKLAELLSSNAAKISKSLSRNTILSRWESLY